MSHRSSTREACLPGNARKHEALEIARERHRTTKIEQISKASPPIAHHWITIRPASQGIPRIL